MPPNLFYWEQTAMTILTYRDLCVAGACFDRREFRRLFGKQVDVTVETARKHAYSALNWVWAGNALLFGEYQAEFARNQSYLYEAREAMAELFARLYNEQGGMDYEALLRQRACDCDVCIRRTKALKRMIEKARGA